MPYVSLIYFSFSLQIYTKKYKHKNFYEFSLMCVQTVFVRKYNFQEFPNYRHLCSCWHYWFGFLHFRFQQNFFCISFRLFSSQKHVRFWSFCLNTSCKSMQLRKILIIEYSNTNRLTSQFFSFVMIEFAYTASNEKL